MLVFIDFVAWRLAKHFVHLDIRVDSVADQFFCYLIVFCSCCCTPSSFTAWLVFLFMAPSNMLWVCAVLFGIFIYQCFTSCCPA